MPDNQSLLAKYDDIVIGAGISGLTTALVLAKEGRRVALFEKDHNIDPLLRPYSRKACECSPGLHIIGWMDDGEVVSSFLNYLNVFDGVERNLNEKGFGNIIIDANKYHFPRGFDNVEKQLLEYFPESAVAISNYLRLIKEINEANFFLNHQLAPSVSKNWMSDLGTETLESLLQKYHGSPELIEVLGTFNYILTGSKAAEVPFMVHAFVLGGFFQSPGVFSINGIKRLLANFKRELARFGVDLFLNAEVVEIVIGTDRKVSGIRAVKGEQFFASNVIVSFNPKLLNETIKDHKLRPIYQRRLAEAENTCGLYVAFYQIEADQEIDIDNFIYHDRKLDVTLGVTLNHSGLKRVISVFLADEAPNIPTDMEVRRNWAEEKLELLENLLYNEMPVLRGKTVLIDYLKPWSFQRYTKTVNGSAYGIKQTANSIGFQHRVPIQGLHLVGQAIYPGFLGSLVSGFGLALELFEADKFWAKVTKE